jgi:hypothetical protein
LEEPPERSPRPPRQASPQAIAAAVQHVSDQKAEAELRRIDLWANLAHLDLEAVQSNQKELQTTADKIEKNAYGTCWAVSSEAQRIADCAP